MFGIKCRITSFISDDQPGFIECKFHDAWNEEHTFHEKAPVITNEHIDSESPYPLNGNIGCTVLDSWEDNRGRSIVSVSTETPWGIESVEGVTKFDVLRDQIIET